MTQEQYQWLKDNGYDPAVYDVDDQGNIFENPVSAVKPKKEVMSVPRAFGTSFAGNILPTAGSLGASAPLVGLAAANPLVGIPLMIGAGMLGGYGTGKLQEAALEKFAPEAQQELLRAQTDQPVASFAGGFAPSAFAFRPDFKGIAGLTAPLMSAERSAARAAFVPAAINVGANVAGAGAGELLNVTEGGEFSTPRFAANVALGSLFSRPTALGRKMGFPDLAPETAAPERLDLAGRRGELAAAEGIRSDEAASARATELLGSNAPRQAEMFGPDARRFELAENQRVVNEAFDKLGLEKNPEVIQDYVNDPMLSNFRDDPAAVLDYVSEKSGLKARSEAETAASEARRQSEAFEAEYAGKPVEMEVRPLQEQIVTDGRRTEIAENRRVIEETLAKSRGQKLPSEVVQDLANDPNLSNIRDNPEELTRFIAEKADKYLENSWQRSMEEINQLGRKLEQGLAQEEVALIDREQERAWAAKEQGIKDIASDLEARFQREGGEGQITQADLDAAAQLAARRGLKLQFTTPEQQAQGLRGAYLINEAGERVIYIDANAATRDTAIHEIGHDVFVRSAGERMKRSLMQTAEDSPAFKAEYEARLAEGKTEAQARDLALEEGVVQAFGEKYPNVPQGEIRSWFNALKASLKSMVGMKLSPEDAARWLHYATTEAVPWKGVAVGKPGEEVRPTEERYQRGLLSKIQTPSELDYLVSKGGPFAEVGTTIKAAANTRDFKQGQWSSKYSLTNALPEEARVRLLNHLAGEFDSGIRKAPAPDLKAAYDQLRNEYLPAIVSDYNNAGFTVRDTAGQRARGSNPTYFPLHAIADEVTNILTTKQGSPEWDKLKADFINWNTQLRQADGASLAEAQRYANEKFDEKLSITAKPPGIESGIPFSGARKPEGYPLPPSWRSDDIIDILNNYTRRSATDFAYQQHVESSPVAMAALGAKNMVNNQPIPANILQSTAPVINDPSVQSVLREYRGTPAQRTEGLLPSIGRFVSAATIGPVSKVGDIGTSMFKGLAYLQGSEYAAGLADFTQRIGDWAALKERSYASGLNKRDAAENMRQVFGIAEDSTAFMDKAARVMSKVTFVNDLESVARVIAQGWGETVVGINKKLALGGDKNALQMLDTLSPDWRTRSDADLAAQVGRLLQGSYDMRQLPASVLEGAAAPYLTWSKWSIGQYDSFVKYAIQPAMQGNMKPLMGQMLIGLLGGGAVSAVQAWLNNREGKDITWKELEAWMQQNQGELGSDGGQLLAQKLLTMAQKMGTFGFAGDLVKMTLDAAAGGSSQGVATMPAVDAIYDVSKRTAAAIQALDDGEDFGLVMKALMKDSLVGHVQALRVARNWLDEDENLRYDDRRRQRLYDALSGLPSKGGAFSVNYSNLSEREFERGELGEGTGEEAMSLVRRAREQATTPEDYASRIRKLKTSQNQIMPSMERQPMKAARYLSWLEGTEEGKGGETMRRYMIRKQEDEYRKSLVEGLSGLR